MPERYREFAKSIAPTVLQGPAGERLVGTIWGLMFDLFASGMRQANMAAWFSAEQPDDALDLIGRERRLPRYLDEDIDDWRERLQNAWDIWGSGGSRELIEDQFAAAGYTGTEVYDPHQVDRTPKPYSTHFWIVIPEGSHNFGAAPVAGDSQICGTGLLCGISGGADVVQRGAEVRDIGTRFRPAHVIARQAIAVIEGELCGTGLLCGALGLVCGGSVAKIGFGVVPE